MVISTLEECITSFFRVEEDYLQDCIVSQPRRPIIHSNVIALLKCEINSFYKLFIIEYVYVKSVSLHIGRSTQYVTCGSVLKLMNVGYKVRLHSHDLKYGTGSGQQSVTGTDVQEDVNSHWVVKGETGKYCVRG